MAAQSCKDAPTSCPLLSFVLFSFGTFTTQDHVLTKFESGIAPASIAMSELVRPACSACWARVQCMHSNMVRFAMQHANDELDPATATLWFAGKQLLPKNQLSHHLGRHEKTKAVIKLQQAGQGAPVREAV